MTLNDGNEYDTHETLYEYAFENYQNYQILNPKKFKIDDAYYPDQIYIKEHFTYPLTEEEKNQVRVEVKLSKLTHYQDQDVVGIVSVKLGDEKIHEQKVYVKKKQKKDSWWQKIWGFFHGE